MAVCRSDCTVQERRVSLFLPHACRYQPTRILNFNSVRIAETARRSAQESWHSQIRWARSCMLTPQQHREGRATVVLRRSDGGRKLAPRHGFDSPDQVSIRLDNYIQNIVMIRTISDRPTRSQKKNFPKLPKSKPG